MKILNFIPLLVWMIVALVVFMLDEHVLAWRNGQEDEETDKANAFLYVAGGLLWLVIGIWMTV